MISYVEKDIEDMIFLTDQSKIRSKGLSCYNHDKVLRQVNLGAYGILDLIGFKTMQLVSGRTETVVTIYELKKDEVGLSAFAQIARYMCAIKRYFIIFEEEKEPDHYEIVLLGSKVEFTSNFIYAASVCPVLRCYTYCFDIDGLNFKAVDFDDFSPSNLGDVGIGVLSKTRFDQIFMAASDVPCAGPF